VGMHGVMGLTVTAADDQSNPATRLRSGLEELERVARRDGLTMAPRTPEQAVRVEQAAALLPASDERDGHISADGGLFSVVVDGVYAPLAVPRSQQAELAALLQAA
jgi:hypothetical protein